MDGAIRRIERCAPIEALVTFSDDGFADLGGTLTPPGVVLTLGLV
jgi:hypothetical protein